VAVLGMALVTTFAAGLLVGAGALAALFVTLRRHPAHGMRQYVAIACAVGSVTAVTVWLKNWFETGGTLDISPGVPPIVSLVSDWIRHFLIAGLLCGVYLYTRRSAEMTAAAHAALADAARMAREATEARLQVLEAQIEPHFLFNTLAHVKRLYETDRDAGVRMLRNLKDYLSIALPQMREAAPTLGREIDHVVAYLGIQQIRMGRRLAYGIDVPHDVRDARVPSLMVLTLVENAVRHGLTPLPEGGRIDVRATASGASLRIDIADTGRGFAKSQGGGTGLANIRARLASTYGPAARLSLALKQPGGVIATIELPFEPPASVVAQS